MTENPWSREFFDLDMQRELCEDGSRDREIYGLLLDAGWPPQDAHYEVMQMARARRLMQEMEERESANEFIGDARARADEEQMKAIEALRRESPPVLPVSTKVLLHVAMSLSVLVLVAWFSV
jgi:predicted anti-sigma-YlaC factor YlaD